MTSGLVNYLHRPWGSVFKDTVAAAYRHDITDAAAAMAFDFVFATFPGILVLTAFMMVAVMAMVAFALDVGYLKVVRTQLQRSAESAALAAA